MIFEAVLPGAWLRDDIANILTVLASSGYDMTTLCAVAVALGLRPAPGAKRVVLIEAAGREGGAS